MKTPFPGIRRGSPTHSLWRGPFAMGAVTIVGLLAALIGDGLWDTVSWLALGSLVATCAWFGMGPQRSDRYGS